MSNIDNEAEYLMALLGIDGSRPSLTLGRRTGTRIRILHGGTSATAPAAPAPTSDRRREPRLPPDQTRWAESAKIRPGLDVRVLDIGSRGVLLEASSRLHVGLKVEITLFATDATTRLDLLGTVRRCHVSSLSPITYQGALEFSQAIELSKLQPFLATEALSA